MAVAPVLIQPFRMLYFTTKAMKIRLTTKMKRLKRFLLISNTNISAIMLMPVTRRNIRSRRLILWLKIISNHFFITLHFLLNYKLSNCPAMLLQTSSYMSSSTG